MSRDPHSFHASNSWPEPSAEERAASRALCELIGDEIAREGPMHFARFMELALYAPGLGYYSAGKPKFGAAGDFLTAPELGGGLAYCLARQIAQVCQALPNADILEVGAGSGRLMIELLGELERLGALPRRYLVLELSAALRARQESQLASRLPQLQDRVRWIDRLPDAGFRGIVLGNELLDAMPVERVRITADGVQELRVAHGLEGFYWAYSQAPPALTELVLRRLGADACLPGYTTEIGHHAEAWVHSMAERLAAGLLLLIDYGFPRDEFYHPDRRDGTLMCHYHHRAHGDPLIHVGLQDITAHVDFSAVADAARAQGLELLGYTSQASFLIAAGLAEYAQQIDMNDTRAWLARTDEIKKLSLPHEMGELFKVIALGRGLDLPLLGFQLADRRARLSSSLS